METSNDSPKWSQFFNLHTLYTELKIQFPIAAPLAAMNLTWFAKTAITTAFLGRLGDLPLAGAALGFTLGNVTGYSVLNGLCGGMEPICGQAFGAKNLKLVRRTLFMMMTLLLAVSIPISILWMNADSVLVLLGQQRDIALVAKKYLIYLIPDLVMISLLCPLKAYLSSQSITLPILFSSAVGAVLHIPVNILLSRFRGLEGISMAVWITDLTIVISLALYVFISEKWSEKRWWVQETGEWIRLLKLAGSCCLTTCLEWWCYEILILLTGHLPNAKQSVGAFAIVLNFDYLIFAFMLSLATCASIRVSNELGAFRPRAAFFSAYFSISLSVVFGFLGGATMVAAKGVWGKLYTHDKGIIAIVKRTMLTMAFVEVINFPVAICGGIVRGTAKPLLGTYANIFGFYLVALPLGGILGMKMNLGLWGLLMGLVAGIVICLVLLLVSVWRIDWEEAARKAHAAVHASEGPDKGVTGDQVVHYDEC